VDFGPDVTYMGNDPHNVYIRHDFVEKGGKAIGMLSGSRGQGASGGTRRADRGERRASKGSQGQRPSCPREAAKLAYAGASAASAVILEHNPDIELPNAEIIAAAEELVEPLDSSPRRRSRNEPRSSKETPEVPTPCRVPSARSSARAARSSSSTRPRSRPSCTVLNPDDVYEGEGKAGLRIYDVDGSRLYWESTSKARTAPTPNSSPLPTPARDRPSW
jgi:hypothetical protein